MRANVSVTSDLVRIGDVIDNAGPAAQIAIYRAPDPGMTGSLPAAKVLAALRAHQVIGVDARDIRDVIVTRLSRTLESDRIEREVARALERTNGNGDAGSFALKFDREVQTLQFDPSVTGSLDPVSVRLDPRGRFEVTFEIAADGATPPTRLRYTGVATETVEVAVLTRGVERNETLRASDIVTERRPKAEVGNDALGRDAALGMQARRQLRAGQPLRLADLAKPDLVQRDQTVMLIYDAAGIYVTSRGKAIEAGTEGDTVSVLNLQSKRTVIGTVTGRGQVSIAPPAPRVVAAVQAPSSSPTE